MTYNLFRYSTLLALTVLMACSNHKDSSNTASTPATPPVGVARIILVHEDPATHQQYYAEYFGDPNVNPEILATHPENVGWQPEWHPFGPTYGNAVTPTYGYPTQANPGWQFVQLNNNGQYQQPTYGQNQQPAYNQNQQHTYGAYYNGGACGWNFCNYPNYGSRGCNNYYPPYYPTYSSYPWVPAYQWQSAYYYLQPVGWYPYYYGGYVGVYSGMWWGSI